MNNLLRIQPTFFHRLNIGRRLVLQKSSNIFIEDLCFRKNQIKRLISNILLVVLCSFLSVTMLKGQGNEADSLSRLLVNASGIKKAEIELNLAKIYRRSKVDEAIKLAEDALSISQEQKNSAVEFRALVSLGRTKVPISPSPEMYKKYLEPARKLDNLVSDPTDKAELYQILALYNNILGFRDSSEYFFKRAFNEAKKAGNLGLLSQIERSIGEIEALRGNYQSAFEYAMSSLKTAESMKDSISIMTSMMGISNVYVQWGNYSFAQDYLDKALTISKKLGILTVQSSILNGFGEIYKKQKQYDTAIDYYMRGLGFDTIRGFTSHTAVYLINIGECYNKKEQPEKALPQIERAIKLFRADNFKEGIARCESELGISYRNLKMFSKSELFFKESQRLAKELNIVDLIISNNREMSLLYSSKGDLNKAFDYYMLYSEMKDTVFSNEKSRQVNELQTRYVTESKEQQIKLQKAEIEKNEAEIERKRLEQWILLGVIIITVFIILLIITGYRKIMKQRDEIKEKNIILEKHEEDIKDSIKYASFIQKAMLPPSEVLTANFPQHFILIRPRDIVSGDFYWCTKIEKQTVIAAVDCTGHGVPGAFMSMLGASLLNEIINKEYITHPGVILRRLRKEIIRGLHQSGKTGAMKDGMDIALCSFDHENMKMQFAGANNPLYLIRRNNEKPIECQNSLTSEDYTLYEIKGDRMPISIFDSMNNFTMYEIDIIPGDLFYIFSDGYADQFGGPNGKKLQYRNFKKLLLSHCSESIEEQKRSLEKALTDWQGNQKQVDDILVIGIKLPTL